MKEISLIVIGKAASNLTKEKEGEVQDLLMSSMQKVIGNDFYCKFDFKEITEIDIELRKMNYCDKTDF